MTRDEAIALAKTEWWKDLPADVVVAFQLFEERMCMDFSDFHGAVEKALGRPVWTHEFGLNMAGIREEFLGKRPQATLQEIFDLIPAEKRVVVVVDDAK